MNTLGKIRHQHKEITLTRDLYASNGRLCVMARLPHGEVYTTISANANEVDLPDADCFLLKCWSECQEVAETILASDIFEDTGLRVEVGYVKSVPILRLKRQVWLVSVESHPLKCFESLESAERWMRLQDIPKLKLTPMRIYP